MEKIIIKSATKVEAKGKEFVNIETEDGRCGSSSDMKFLEFIGKEIECEVKDSGREYKNIKQYYFNLPKPEGAKKGFAPKDYTADKKMCALTNAVNSIKQTEGKVSSDAILTLADKYFDYLNKK